MLKIKPTKWISFNTETNEIKHITWFSVYIWDEFYSNHILKKVFSILNNKSQCTK